MLRHLKLGDARKAVTKLVQCQVDPCLLTLNPFENPAFGCGILSWGGAQGCDQAGAVPGGPLFDDRTFMNPALAGGPQFAYIVIKAKGLEERLTGCAAGRISGCSGTCPSALSDPC